MATDLAARGIDIEGVSHVINDAIPLGSFLLVHRVTRTGLGRLQIRCHILFINQVMIQISVNLKINSFQIRVLKMGLLKILMTGTRANVRKSKEKLDIEMIGLKKKEKNQTRLREKLFLAVDEKRRKAKRV